jgi:hypothetical protein
MTYNNIDYKVVSDFGLEWNKFNYQKIKKKIYKKYFMITLEFFLLKK